MFYFVCIYFWNVTTCNWSRSCIQVCLFRTKPECILLIIKQKITCILLSIEQSKARDDIIHNAKMWGIFTVHTNTIHPFTFYCVDYNSAIFENFQFGLRIFFCTIKLFETKLEPKCMFFCKRWLDWKKRDWSEKSG